MKERTVEIIIKGGAVQDVQMPPGIRVVIRDYDVEGTDQESGFDIRQDSEGDSYQRREFREEGDETTELETEQAPGNQ